jgi:hypothetical protein
VAYLGVGARGKNGSSTLVMHCRDRLHRCDITHAAGCRRSYRNDYWATFLVSEHFRCCATRVWSNVYLDYSSP